MEPKIANEISVDNKEYLKIFLEAIIFFLFLFQIRYHFIVTNMIMCLEIFKLKKAVSSCIHKNLIFEK